MRVQEIFDELRSVIRFYGNVRTNIDSLKVVTTQVRDELGKISVEQVVIINTKEEK